MFPSCVCFLVVGMVPEKDLLGKEILILLGNSDINKRI